MSKKNGKTMVLASGEGMFSGLGMTPKRRRFLGSKGAAVPGWAQAVQGRQLEAVAHLGFSKPLFFLFFCFFFSVAYSIYS